MDYYKFHYWDEDNNGFLSKNEVEVQIKNDLDTYDTLGDDGVSNTVKEIFDKQDLNGDGQISIGENAYNLNGQQTIKKEDYQKEYGVQATKELFDEYGYDIDGGQRITLDEIKEKDDILQKKQQSLTDFRNFDEDNNGFLSKKEVEKIGNDGIGGEVQEILESQDLNGDKQASVGEFILYGNEGKDITKQYLENNYGKGYAKYFLAKYDINGDNTVTKDEIKTVDVNNKNVELKMKNNSSTNKTAIIFLVILSVLVITLIIGLIITLSEKRKQERKYKNKLNDINSSLNNINQQKNIRTENVDV